MTKDSNIQHAADMRRLADIYDHAGYSDGPAIKQNGLYIFCDDKEEMLNVIRAIGGKFTKDFGHHATKLVLTTPLIPGLQIMIDRDKVCRATVSYDCDPIFSPGSDSEIDADYLSADSILQI